MYNSGPKTVNQDIYKYSSVHCLDAVNVVQKGELVLDSHPLTVKWPEPDVARREMAVSRSLMISGLDPKTSQELLHMYFENYRISGGGPIEHINHEPNRGMAVITFENASGKAELY